MTHITVFTRRLHQEPPALQVAGQEVEAATSPATAFTLEKLLAAADVNTTLSFLRAVLETQDAFGSIATK